MTYQAKRMTYQTKRMTASFSTCLSCTQAARHVLQRSLDTSRKASALISRDLDEAKRQIRVLEGKVREGKCAEGSVIKRSA